MAFDLTTPSPERKMSPEVVQTPETLEVPVEVPQAEQAPAPEYTPAESQATQYIEVPHAEPAQAQPEPSPVFKRVEGALADPQIAKHFFEMSPDQRAPFKAAGEKLTAEITADIIRGKFKPYKALNGTRKWLGMIDAKFPYLLQKSKNELDALLQIDEAYKKGEIPSM